MTAQELINKIAPRHSRTSCSDENISNGFVSFEIEGDDTAIDTKYNCRCARCGLLEIARKKIQPNGDIDSISFHFSRF